MTGPASRRNRFVMITLFAVVAAMVGETILRGDLRDRTKP